jgi:hypothetical protein
MDAETGRRARSGRTDLPLADEAGHKENDMNALDRHNLREQTKGGQPATAAGALGPGQAYGKAIADALDAKDTPQFMPTPVSIISEERGWAAFDLALGLRYSIADAKRFQVAARDAAKVGLGPNGLNYAAGRLIVGYDPISGTYRLSVRTDSGGYFDPAREDSIGNNPAGSD